MAGFVFQIIALDHRVLAQETRHLPNIPSVWSELVRMAWQVNESGARMEVRDDSGDVVIRVGIATARATAGKIVTAA